MTKIYAIAATVPDSVTYLTAGKRYKVLGESGDVFFIVGDDGGDTECNWKNCLFLGGGDWTRVEEHPEPYWTADQFRTARKSMGLTRVQLAEHLDCALRTVERCEADGCRKVMAMAMERLAMENINV